MRGKVYALTVYPNPAEPGTKSWCAHLLDLPDGELVAPTLAGVLLEVRKRIEREERKR